MIIVTDAQLTAFIADEESFLSWYVDRFMPEHLPEFCRLFERGTLREMLRRGRRQALTLGFVDPWSQAHVLTLMWRVGANFLRQPGFREVAADHGAPVAARIDRLYAVDPDLAADAILAADDRAWFEEENEDQPPASAP